jgi:uncharacterized protein
MKSFLIFLKKIREKHPFISLIIFFFPYYVPVILLYIGIIAFKMRYLMLIIISIVMIFYAIACRYSWIELGFRKDNIIKSLIWNGIFSVFMFFILLILVSGPLQEFLYRSVVFAELNRYYKFSQPVMVTISAINYCFLHIFYKDLITLCTTLIAGLIWGSIYSKYPNFFGSTLSHSFLGAISILLGLI